MISQRDVTVAIASDINNNGSTEEDNVKTFPNSVCVLRILFI